MPVGCRSLRPPCPGTKTFQLHPLWVDRSPLPKIRCRCPHWQMWVPAGTGCSKILSPPGLPLVLRPSSCLDCLGREEAAPYFCRKCSCLFSTIHRITGKINQERVNGSIAAIHFKMRKGELEMNRGAQPQPRPEMAPFMKYTPNLALSVSVNTHTKF